MQQNDSLADGAGETKMWAEGELLLFDDSFEHAVWHDGSGGSAPRTPHTCGQLFLCGTQYYVYFTSHYIVH